MSACLVRLVGISNHVHFFDCFVFACLIDAFLCLCSVHRVCILRSIFLVCAAFASAYLMLGWLCPPPCLIVLCLSLYFVLFVRVWSVQLTAPGLAGHHGRSVRCPVEVGTINERAHAPALPLPMEGISASACTQRRLFATRTPVMVRSVPFQNHKWDKKSFKWNVLQKNQGSPNWALPLSVSTRYIWFSMCHLSINTHYYNHLKKIQFLWRLISTMEYNYKK